MSSSFNRRDFLKLTGLVPLSLATPRAERLLYPAPSAQGGSKNVIVVVFDACSAYNISLYGYQRDTMPNLAKLADRAIVYHNHFAGSNYTTSGTASLLTGTLPWTHRALQPNGQVAPRFVSRNIFAAFRDYYRLAYTHNGFAYTLLRQAERQMDQLVPRTKLFLASYDSFLETLFQNDEDIATVSWTRDMQVTDQGFAYSLFISHLYKVLQEGKIANLEPLFPRGLPTTGSGNGFLLEQAVDWLSNLLTSIPQPFLGYFHFMPPHFPYRTAIEFYNRFKDDNYEAAHKPRDIFAPRRTGEGLSRQRTEYDEFILYVDREFGRFYRALEASGLLDNSWLVFTSDHGEMFERGIVGHGTNVLYQPLVRIPLLVFEPGRPQRMDVYTPTSAVDVLPTLAHVTGHAIPDWTEGVVLPPYAGTTPDPQVPIYAVRSTATGTSEPLKEASIMLVKGRYKLHYYFGYHFPRVDELVKLYDIEADPEELVDLSSSQKDVAAELLDELKAKLAEVNRPYL